MFFSVYSCIEWGVQGLNKPKTSQWNLIKSIVASGFKSRSWESTCSGELPWNFMSLVMICFKDGSRMVQKSPPHNNNSKTNKNPPTTNTIKKIQPMSQKTSPKNSNEKHVFLIFVWLRSCSSSEILGKRQVNCTKAVKYNYIQKL